MRFRALRSNYKSSANEAFETSRTSKFMEKIPHYNSIGEENDYAFEARDNHNSSRKFSNNTKDFSRVEIMELLGPVKYSTEFVPRPIENKQFVLRQYENMIESASNEYKKNMFSLQQFGIEKNTFYYKAMDSSKLTCNATSGVVPGAMFQKTMEILSLSDKNNTKSIKANDSENDSLEKVWMDNNKIWLSMDVLPSPFLQQETTSIDLYNDREIDNFRNCKNKRMNLIEQPQDRQIHQINHNNYTKMKISTSIISKFPKDFGIKSHVKTFTKHAFATSSLSRNNRKGKYKNEMYNSKNISYSKENDGKGPFSSSGNDTISVDDYYKINLLPTSKNAVQSKAVDVNEGEFPSIDNSQYLTKFNQNVDKIYSKLQEIRPEIPAIRYDSLLPENTRKENELNNGNDQSPLHSTNSSEEKTIKQNPSTSMHILVQLSRKKILTHIQTLQKQLNHGEKVPRVGKHKDQVCRPSFFEPLPKIQKITDHTSRYYNNYLSRAWQNVHSGNQTTLSTEFNKKVIIPQHEKSCFTQQLVHESVHLSNQFIEQNDVPLPLPSSEEKKRSIQSNNTSENNTINFPKISSGALSKICFHNQSYVNQMKNNLLYKNKQFSNNYTTRRFRLPNDMQFKLLLKSSQKQNCKIFLPQNCQKRTYHSSNRNEVDKNNTAIIRNILSSDDYGAYQKSFLLKHKFCYPALQIDINDSNSLLDIIQRSKLKEEMDKIFRMLYTGCTTSKMKKKSSHTIYKSFLTGLPISPHRYEERYYKTILRSIIRDDKLQSEQHSSERKAMPGNSPCSKNDLNHNVVISTMVMRFFQKRCHDKYISSIASIKKINHDSPSKSIHEKADNGSPLPDSVCSFPSNFLLKNKRHPIIITMDGDQTYCQQNDQNIGKAAHQPSGSSVSSFFEKAISNTVCNLTVHRTTDSIKTDLENPENIAFLPLNDVNIVSEESIKIRSELFHLHNRAMRVEHEEVEVSTSNTRFKEEIQNEEQCKAQPSVLKHRNDINMHEKSLLIEDSNDPPTKLYEAQPSLLFHRHNQTTHERTSLLKESDSKHPSTKSAESYNNSNKKQKTSKDEIEKSVRSGKEKKRKKHHKKDKNNDRKKRKKYKKEANQSTHYVKKEEHHQNGSIVNTNERQQQQIQKKIRETTKFNPDGSTTKISMATITIVKKEKIEIEDYDNGSNKNYATKPKELYYNNINRKENLENQVQITPVVVDKKGNFGKFNSTRESNYHLNQRNNTTTFDDEKENSGNNFNSYFKDLNASSAVSTAITPSYETNKGTVHDHSRLIPVDITPINTINPALHLQQPQSSVKMIDQNNGYDNGQIFTQKSNSSNYLDYQPRGHDNNYLNGISLKNNLAQDYAQYSDNSKLTYYNHESENPFSSDSSNNNFSSKNTPCMNQIQYQHDPILQQKSCRVARIDDLNKHQSFQHQVYQKQEFNVIALCSEKFFEEWPQVVTQLTTGSWAQSYLAQNDQQVSHHAPVSKLHPLPQDNHRLLGPPPETFSITVCDCPLIDYTKVDIELPHQRAIVLMRLSSLMRLKSINNQDVTAKKQILKQMVQLASVGRYRYIHFLLVADECDIFEEGVFQEIATFQNALIGQSHNGCPCQTIDFLFCNLANLPCLLAERMLLSAKTKQAVNDDRAYVEEMAQDTIVQERARFLISIAPSLSVFTIFHCFYQYSNEGDNDSYFRNLLQEASMDNARFWNILYEGYDKNDQFFLQRCGKHLQYALHSLLSSNPKKF